MHVKEKKKKLVIIQNIINIQSFYAFSYFKISLAI